MAIYTTQLRSIVEQCQAEAHVGPDDFTVAYARLGLSDYPIFDETYRQPLNDKIIRHFYFREIGEETVARFRWRIRATMWEQMPYYNQLYSSLDLVTDPLTNIHYTYSDVVAETASEDGTTSKTGSLSRDATVTETHAGEDVTEEARGTTTTEELEHGHTVTEDRTHGHTVTEELDHGRTVTETLQHGHVTDDSQVTNYGRTQATVNGGSDQTLDGKTSEREIKSDTPMNQITAGGVEGLNYATEVTYTDREGTRAGTTTYGGTTNVSYGGADTVTDRTIQSGTDTTTTGTTGTDTTTTTNAGTDTDTTTNAGTDTTTTTTDGADTTTVTHGHTVTTATDDDTTTTESGTDSRDTTRDTTRDHERMGYDGISQSRLLEEFRKTFLNVDLRVIESLEPCFFGLWM